MSIRALVAVADEGTFSAAAASLEITQSAVSQHVAGLERTVGLPLVEPGTRPTELTAAGQLLVAHGRAVLGRLGTAEYELGELGEVRNSRVRLGSFPTALATFVPTAIRRARRDEPSMSITVVDDHMQQLWPRLDRHELDVAVVFDDGAVDPRLPPDFELTPLFTDDYRLVLPRGHRRAGSGRSVALREVADETWIGGGPASSWFRTVRDACAAAGFSPRVGLVSDDYLAVQAFVGAGLGVAVIPGLAVARRLPGVEVVSLRGSAIPRRRIAVAHVSGPFVPSAATVLVRRLHEVTRRWAPG